jgi:hypothetical protein
LLLLLELELRDLDSCKQLPVGKEAHSLRYSVRLDLEHMGEEEHSCGELELLQ